MRIFSLYGFHLEHKETKKTNGQQTPKGATGHTQYCQNDGMGHPLF
jgi:hypothetical protein